MKRRIFVAVLQLLAHDRDAFASVAPRLLERIAEAAAAGARLIVFPEGTVPAYVLGEEPLDRGRCEAAYAALAAAAARHDVHLVGGGAWFAPAAPAEASPLNAALLFAPDGRVVASGKRFLWHFDRRWYAAGATLEPIETEIGRLGLLVCADCRVPTIAATLVDRGAELLVVPTAWIANGADPARRENPLADRTARARARENDVPLVAANKTGVERDSVLYCGKSQIVDRDGAVLAIAPPDVETTLYAEVAYGDARPHRVRRTPAEDPSSGADAAPFAPPDARVVRLGFAQRLSRGIRETARWSDVDLLVAPRARPASSESETDAAPIALDAWDAREPRVLAGLPCVRVDDEDVADPTALPPWRRRGCLLFFWRRRREDVEAAVELARVRAIELRAYVCCYVEADDGRSIVIDPDGATIAGTTAAYALMQAAIDPSRTATTIVPGTDVLDGLDRVAAMTASA